MGIFKRKGLSGNDMWYIRYWKDGKENRQVAGPSKRDAELKLADALRELGRRPTARHLKRGSAVGLNGNLTIYFVQAQNGLIKIGITYSIKNRLAGLQSHSPVPLSLLATTTGGMEKERALHIQFAALRSHGEWFHPGEELLRFIKETVPKVLPVAENTVLRECLTP